MTENLPLISTIAIALGLALIMGFIAVKLKMPAIVGYLLAGVMIGPFTPGFVANTHIAVELAEIGIMLLMFGVGLHFSLDQLIAMRKIALPGALIQIFVATLMGAGLATYWGWNLGASLVFGLALSVASTVVLLRALEMKGLLDSINGQIAVGWLIVEDLAMVVVLVLLPPFADSLGGSLAQANQNIWLILLETFLKIAAFIAVMLFIGQRFFPKLLWHVARTGSRELFTLCVVAAAISIAYGASRLFGISFALGAFFAGIIIRESKFSRRAAEESLPLRDAFAVLFFVSVGMLFDPTIFVQRPLQVLAVVFIIVIGKSLAAFGLVLAFRYPLNSALTISASLAQIGEFSFILAGLGVNLKLLPIEGQKLILAGALISIAINPLLFKMIEPIQVWIRSRSAVAKALDKPFDPLVELPMETNAKYLCGQIVLIGYGRLGRRIADKLLECKLPFIVVEQNRKLVENLRRQKIIAVLGDGLLAEVLVEAKVAHADMLVITIPDSITISQIGEIAKELNPKIEIVARTINEEEAIMLEEEIPGDFFYSIEALTTVMCRFILKRFGMTMAD